MRITYDSEVDVLYISFHETTVTTKHFDGLSADYDSDGRLAGIEILDAAQRLGGKDIFRRIVLEDVAVAR